MTFKETLERQILVLDGAMGTRVQSLNLTDAAFGGEAFKMLSDLLVFSRPDALQNIHLEYLRAGANLLETNTFGASPLRLREFDFTRLDPSDMQGLPPGFDLRQNDYDAITRHLNLQGVRLARRAIEQYRAEPDYDGRPLFVAASIGPSNYVISSTEADLKRASFEEIVANVRSQVAALMEANVDLLLFETQQDILELKASIVAARRVFREIRREVPILAQVTVDGFSKMQIFNTDIHAAYTTVGELGIDVFGINCNVGPDEMKGTVERLSRVCRHPISVVPNAGQPVSEDGRTVYKLQPQAMADTMERFVREFGVALVGGCCGTTPDHIRELADRVRGLRPLPRDPDRRVFVSGPQEAVPLDGSQGLLGIGERLNVRGSKKVRDAVERESDIDYAALDAVVTEQVKDLGLTVIDVCMDSNIVETETVLPQVIYRLTSDFPGVMCLDSFSVEALAAAIQVYPGRPILNSISLEEYGEGQSKLDAVLSLTREHNPVYIALVNGPEGPAQTAEEKVTLAGEILRRARDDYGVNAGQLLIDLNAYPIGSESVEGLNFCAETLEALPRVKALHPDLKTTVGVGNLTNGLQQKPYMRKVLTSVFLDESRRRGLDAAILNPNHYVPLESLPQHDVDLARKVILHRDMDAFEELERIALAKKGEAVEKKVDYADLAPEERICRKIYDGFKQKETGTVDKAGTAFPYRDRIVLEVVEIIDRHEPLDFISEYLMETMRQLGDAFGRGEVSLPHLLKSADVMRSVMEFLEAYMRKQSGAEAGEAVRHKGVVVLGTVYQDVHSIGKDLAKTLLENYGYRVIDLGVQVPLERFLETARQENADAIGMSALLVQTSNHMITVARMLSEQAYPIPILIGGAPVNRRHAGFVAMHGQSDLAQILDHVFYCESGMEGVNTMNRLQDPRERDALLARNKDKLRSEYQKAKGALEEQEKLLATLPRRMVGFKHHEVPREGYGIHKVEFKLSKLSENLDTKSLYSLNWKFGKKSTWDQKGVTPEKLKSLEKEWIEKATHNGWIVPKARFALLPAQSEDNDLILYDPQQPDREIARIHFSVCIGKGRKDQFSVAQYFYPRSSGKMDVAGLQITTAGREVERVIHDFKKQNDSESAHYLQGLSDRVAEDLAEYIHRLLCRRAGKKKNEGLRYSPGYPALTDLINNRVLWETLKAEDLGVTLTSSNEFDPPSTTAAVVCFHRDASYT